MADLNTKAKKDYFAAKKNEAWNVRKHRGGDIIYDAQEESSASESDLSVSSSEPGWSEGEVGWGRWDRKALKVLIKVDSEP